MGKLKEAIAKGRPRKFLDHADPLGKVIHELQDAVDAHDATLTGGGDIGTNATAIAALQTEVETASTGLLDRATAAEAAITAIKAHTDVRSVPVSFETGEVGTVNLFFPSAVTITGARVCVTKALAGTDAGTIQLANNGGTNMTSGLLTVALSSAVGTDVAVTPSANNVLTAGQKAQVTTAKTTAGGRGILTLEYTYN